jgi:hypothetical protein
MPVIAMPNAECSMLNAEYRAREEPPETWRSAFDILHWAFGIETALQRLLKRSVGLCLRLEGMPHAVKRRGSPVT